MPSLLLVLSAVLSLNVWSSSDLACYAQVMVTCDPAGPVERLIASTVVITCALSGHDSGYSFVTKWSFKGQEIDTSRFSSFDLNDNSPTSTLALTALALDDSGLYTCIADRIGDPDDPMDTVVVNVRDPPVAMVDAEFRFAEGKTATLSCSTESLPAPVSIKWTNKDSEEVLLEETPNPSNPLELILPNVTREESGEYICTVSNELSSGEATTTLVVLCPPSPPSELTSIPLNETSIKLKWSVPPGVLDEELTSYLVEVRNESGGLIVLSETDGTEYTFSMDNPDPCVLYSFTVTPLCGTVEGWSAKVNGTPFNVTEQVTVMGFTLELMDNEEAIVTLTVLYSGGVCAYSVNATSTDGKVGFFIDKWFPLPGESTVSISLQLPTSEEYYITVSACNALGCGPPSSPVFIMYMTATTVHTTEVYSSDVSHIGLHTTPMPTSNTTRRETHTRTILIGTVGAGMVLILLASLITLLVYIVRVHQAKSCNEHKDTGAYETVEIANPAPVGCPMSENQAYGIARKPMLEERKAPKLSNQHSTQLEVASTNGFE